MYEPTQAGAFSFGSENPPAALMTVMLREEHDDGPRRFDALRERGVGPERVDPLAFEQLLGARG